MARRFVRDARGRFASKGVGGIGAYQGQTGGRGARLKTPGNTRAGGGAISKVTQQGERKGIVSLGKKRKGLSEGQRYASTQAKAKAARQADTTKRLEAFNKKIANNFDLKKRFAEIEKLDKDFQKKFPKLDFILLRENSNVI